MLVYKIVVSSRNSLDLLPHPDLSGVESQVALEIESLRHEIEKDPSSASAWGRLAMSLHVHGLSQAAIQCYKQAATLDPDEIRWPYYCGIIMYELGLSQNLHWFQLSQGLRPGYAPIHIRYGEALYNSGLLKKSSGAFSKAVNVDPKSSHAYLGLARVALANGDLTASQQQLLKALDLDPSHKEAHWLLATVYRRLKEPQKANRELKKAEQLPEVTPLYDPLYADLLNEGVSSYWGQLRGRAFMKKGRYESAAREFRLVLNAKPNAEAHYDLGLALQFLGQYKEAVENFKKSLSLDANSIETLGNLAISLSEMGQTEEALVYLKKALDLNPTSANHYINFGMIYMRLGRTAEAIDVFRRGLINVPNDVHISIRLAWLLSTSSQASLRDGAEALRIAKAACERTNYRMPQALDVLAAAHAEEGRFDRAIALVTQAHDLANSADRPDLASMILSRLNVYKSKRPFRDKGLRP